MKLGVLASHNGSTLQAILDACARGALNAEVAVVISNNKRSMALERARASGVNAHTINAITHPDPGGVDRAIATTLNEAHCDWVILAGYMKRLGPVTLKSFDQRVLNVHPSLLPKYGGQGMYGLAVHEAVLAAGDAITGATVHRVSDEYDEGEILAQSNVSVRPGDSAELLQKRVQAAERGLLIDTLIELSSEGTLPHG